MVDQEFPVAVVMELKRLDNPWVAEKWEVRGVIPDVKPAATRGEPIVVTDASRQFLYSGLRLKLFKDEAEGYFLNLSSPEPRVFVMWRLEESVAVPVVATVSYNEAARMMDAGETVDGVAMLPDIGAWLARFVEAHYRPEPKKIRSRDAAS